MASSYRLVRRLLGNNKPSFYKFNCCKIFPTIPNSSSSTLLSSLIESHVHPSNNLCSLSATTRFFSTGRRHPTRPTKVDIGARARQMQNRRLWTYAVTFSCIAGFIIIQKQVLEGSVAYPASTHEIEFVITDLITDILVRFEGQVPDLFREGHSVVVVGFMKPIAEQIKKEATEKSVSVKARSVDCYFSASEVLSKHDEKYMPAEVASAIEKNKKKLAEEAANQLEGQEAVSSP